MSHGSIKYRPDIDGLRGLAVLSVVLFHYFPAILPGGFIGVDIFFVISGFLISSIILGQIDNGSFRFRDFYARRIRRIFPALALMLVVVLVLGWFTLFWDEYKQLGLHIAYGVGFMSNLALWKESGYFDKANDVKPLLHLWSLGIEEQFYILWPLILFFLGRFKTIRSVVVAIFFIASFAFSLSIIQKDAVQAFYSPLSRSWELMAGTFLAVIPGALSQIPTKIKHIVSCLGFASLIFGNFAMNDQIQFPGTWALLPVIGACLVMLSGKEACINRYILGNKAIVFVGLISFPLYLWHWPILTFYRILSGGDMTNSIKIVLLLASCVLATVTFLGVEKKIRFNASQYYIVPSLCLSMALVGTMGYLVYAHGGYHQRQATKPWRQFTEYTKPYDQVLAQHHIIGCDRQKYLDLSAVLATGLNYCQVTASDGIPDSVLIGDSHAGDKYFGFVDENPNSKLMLLGNSACPMLWSLETQGFPLHDPTSNPDANACRIKFDAIIKFVESTPAIKLVLIAFGNQIDALDDGADPPEKYSAFPSYAGLSKRDLAYRMLDATLTKLEQAGKRVAILEDVPRLSLDPRDCVRRNNSDQCKIPVEDLMKAQKVKQAALLQDLKLKHPEMGIIDPTPYFCGEKTCNFMQDGSIWYQDTHHLSPEGSDYFAKNIVPLLPK